MKHLMYWFVLGWGFHRVVRSAIVAVGCDRIVDMFDGVGGEHEV